MGILRSKVFWSGLGAVFMAICTFFSVPAIDDAIRPDAAARSQASDPFGRSKEWWRARAGQGGAPQGGSMAGVDYTPPQGSDAAAPAEAPDPEVDQLVARAAVEARAGIAAAAKGNELWSLAQAAERSAQQAQRLARQNVEGYGAVRGQQANGRTFVYEGQVRAGRQEGYGVQLMNDGRMLLGEWSGGEPSGLIVERYPNDNVTAYRRTGNQATGYMYFEYENGETYLGQVPGAFGRGTYTGAHYYLEGTTLAGAFEVDGARGFTRTGLGELRTPEGDIVTGQFVRGNVNGAARVETGAGQVAKGRFVKNNNDPKLYRLAP